MVVAATAAETLEPSLGLIGKSFFIVIRSGRVVAVEDRVSGFDANGDGQVALRMRPPAIWRIWVMPAFARITGCVMH